MNTFQAFTTLMTIYNICIFVYINVKIEKIKKQNYEYKEIIELQEKVIIYLIKCINKFKKRR